MVTRRVLLLATTTGYQTRTFGEAAERLGVELVFATDRCHVIDDPWRDAAIPIRFYDEDAAVEAILAVAVDRPIDGVVAVGDRPTLIAARVASALGLPWHSAEGAAVARNKLRTRERLRDAGLPVPWFSSIELDGQGRGLTPSVAVESYPCVVKPLSLSGSRGVMRADDPASLAAAVTRLHALMRSPDIRAERNDAHETALVEGFIPGREYAVEALLHHGAIHPLAIFDKPDPLDGPFFEETIYVTPPDLGADAQAAILDAVARAAAAVGLGHGPIHAECRVNASTRREPEGRPERGLWATGSGPTEVFVLEVAARPIGGLCARALRFGKTFDGDTSRSATEATSCPLEEVLLRHALGECPATWRREGCAAGVMMIPIPRRGVLRGVAGVEAACDVPCVDEVRITAKADQVLVPLPEGASYLGFIFARADRACDVERALRQAHARLRFTIEAEFPVRASV